MSPFPGSLSDLRFIENYFFSLPPHHCQTHLELSLGTYLISSNKLPDYYPQGQGLYFPLFFFHPLHIWKEMFFKENIL